LAEVQDEANGRRSRRRRGRGRGRNRDQNGLSHEEKVEDRAINEGLPVEGNPDLPIATVIADEEAPAVVAEADTGVETAPIVQTEEPKRRRVRRKTRATGAEEASAEMAEAPAPVAAPVEVEAEVVSAPVLADPAANEQPAFVAPITDDTRAAISARSFLLRSWLIRQRTNSRPLSPRSRTTPAPPFRPVSRPSWT